MQAYRWTAERVLRELNSAPGGLSRKQAAARLEKHGENRLAQKKGDSLWRRFMLQLSDPMILVLLAAAAVSAVLCVVHREFPADVLIIMTVVTVNAVLGVVQESKAEKAIAALQEMTPATSRVLRLLDEATASLDVENETKVQSALSRLLAGKTVLVIAHRMRTVAGADHIVVLENGRVAEQGTPAELMEKGTLYRHMVELQSESSRWKLG